MSLAFDWRTELELLSEHDGDVPYDSINKFVESELPNELFLSQFIHVGVKPFSDKKYWENFARILIGRGISRTADVRAKMLLWLQDLNWPGSSLIWDFVSANISVFKVALKECIISAIKTDDEAWLHALLALILKSRGLSDLEISQKLRISDERLRSNYSSEIGAKEIDRFFSEIAFD